MNHEHTVQEAINEARFAVRQAVKIDAGRRAMEGDIESADIRLQDASEWLRMRRVPEPVVKLPKQSTF